MAEDQEGEHPLSWRNSHRDSFIEKYSQILPADAPANETLSLIARLMAGLEFLGNKQGESSSEDVVHRAKLALEMLQHGALEFERVLEPFTGIFDQLEASQERLRLKGMAKFALASIIPGARLEDRLVLLPLPGSYVATLVEHLEALDHGERDTMFAPQQTGKHSQPYAWAKAREEAILHVAFMQGGGRTKTASRELIGRAIGVAPNTLRDWERDVWTGDIDHAREAGRIEQERVGLGIPWPEPIDAHVCQMIERLSGRLPGFASWYRGTFGKRHWGAAGD